MVAVQIGSRARQGAAAMTDHLDEVAKRLGEHPEDWRRDALPQPKRQNGPEPPRIDGTPLGAALTLEEWLARDVPEPDHLLGAMLSTTCRALLCGPTGLGKTMFGLAAAIAMAEGRPFLHWRGGRSCRVLYVDGEISRREMKRRLKDAVRRAEAMPEADLTLLSREDFESMPPLNTRSGQKWIDDFIEAYGPFDFIFFDNIQALLSGNMKEEEQWAEMLPWVKSLTRRAIGQMWFHHTGHDESRSYGSKAREWQMDLVILMERVEVPGADLAFSIKFTKAREKTPDNRADFEPVTMSLQDDKWTHTQTPTPRKALGLNQKVMLGILAEAMPEGLELTEWNAKAREHGVTTRQRLFESRKELKDRKLVHECADRWYVTSS
jgi:KaiC/GvpD/RAD55 family RecA-like ATPase